VKGEIISLFAFRLLIPSVMKKNLLFLCLLIATCQVSRLDAQVSSAVFDSKAKLAVSGFTVNKQEVKMPAGSPFFSMLIDSVAFRSDAAGTTFIGDTILFSVRDSISGTLIKDNSCNRGLKYLIRFTNNGRREHKIENLVPLGEGPDKVYITAGGTKEGPHYLCRSLLFRPGYMPVGVILPDNAWHLGFSDTRLNDTLSLTAMARRTGRDKDKAMVDRWAVVLKPSGWVEYSMYFDTHKGEWQEGLRMMFGERFLYDLPAFDNSMFLRTDLQWMKSRYIMLLQFAWDDRYYDYSTQQYTYYKSLFEYDDLTGGYDIFTIWPTWPRLGLDQRNQWDMYRDIPGGLAELMKQSAFAHSHGKKYFISYNPWDDGTRREDQMNGMETLLRATDADGVVLDTKGSSSIELQAAADKVKPGIIMYSEGMAVPKDMPGIVSGRVHDALVMPPPLNLNKYIKPDFAIFRVLQLADDRIHRELACAFFNGYGVEINTMRPGRAGWIKEEFAYLGRTTRILRENDVVFHNDRWIPLVRTLADSVWVNRWQGAGKTLYTIYSLRTAGYRGPLFNIPGVPDSLHYIDLWNHCEISPLKTDGQASLAVYLEPFDRDYLGTRREGNVGCVALFPKLLRIEKEDHGFHFSASSGDRIMVWGNDPSYASKGEEYPISGGHIDYAKSGGRRIIQLFAGSELIDELASPGFMVPGFPTSGTIHIVTSAAEQAKPRPVTWVSRTKKAKTATAGMIEVRAGSYRFYSKRDEKAAEAFIPFPDHSDTVSGSIKRFFIDKFPVTNRDYSEFLAASGYMPDDTSCFLRHWGSGRKPCDTIMNKPVVYVCPDDAEAYCRHYKKRLPSEREWQYAAQGNDMRTWPWGNLFDSTLCNTNLNHETDVNAFPKGASPSGIEDLIGNVWQMTNDVYYDGAYYYRIIKGGSYYHPTQSIWYVTGGPVPSYHPEMLLQIAPGLDRNATIGFRCVKDAD